MLYLRDYLDAVRVRQALQSDYELAQHLRVTKQHISAMRRSIVLPSDELMVKIAEDGGKDPLLALLCLDYWKTRWGKAKAVRKTLIERFGGTAVALAIGFTALGAPSPTRAAVQSGSAHCILWNRARAPHRRRRACLVPAVTAAA